MMVLMLIKFILHKDALFLKVLEDFKCRIYIIMTSNDEIHASLGSFSYLFRLGTSLNMFC